MAAIFRLFLAWVCLFALSAQAGTIVCTNADFQTARLTNKLTYVYFLDAPQDFSGVGITRDRMRYTNDGTGYFTITNYVPGNYRFEFVGPYTTTTNWFEFPTTNGTINAHDPAWGRGPTNGAPLALTVPAARLLFTPLATNNSVAADAAFLSKTGTNTFWVTGTGSGFTGDGNQFSGTTVTHIKSGAPITNTTVWATTGNFNVRRGDGLNFITVEQNGGLDFSNGFYSVSAAIDDGSAIALLNANNLASGTVPAQRLPTRLTNYTFLAYPADTNVAHIGGFLDSRYVQNYYFKGFTNVALGNGAYYTNANNSTILYLDNADALWLLSSNLTQLASTDWDYLSPDITLEHGPWSAQTTDLQATYGLPTIHYFGNAISASNSFNLSGAVSAQAFAGDGGGISNLLITASELPYSSLTRDGIIDTNDYGWSHNWPGQQRAMERLPLRGTWIGTEPEISNYITWKKTVAVDGFNVIGHDVGSYNWKRTNDNGFLHPYWNYTNLPSGPVGFNQLLHTNGFRHMMWYDPGNGFPADTAVSKAQWLADIRYIATNFQPDILWIDSGFWDFAPQEILYAVTNNNIEIMTAASGLNNLTNQSASRMISLGSFWRAHDAADVGDWPSMIEAANETESLWWRYVGPGQSFWHGFNINSMGNLEGNTSWLVIQAMWSSALLEPFSGSSISPAPFGFPTQIRNPRLLEIQGDPAVMCARRVLVTNDCWVYLKPLETPRGPDFALAVINTNTSTAKSATIPWSSLAVNLQQCFGMLMDSAYGVYDMKADSLLGEDQLQIVVTSLVRQDYLLYRLISTNRFVYAKKMRVEGNGSITGRLTNDTLTANTVLLADGSTAPALKSLANGGNNTLLHGTAPPAYSAVVEADLGLTDLTTANSSTSAHGFLKKLDNTATHYMDGSGNWSVPAGSGGAGLDTTAWHNTGDSFGATKFIGTTDDRAFIIKANSLEIARFTNNSSVGPCATIAYTTSPPIDFAGGQHLVSMAGISTTVGAGTLKSAAIATDTCTLGGGGSSDSVIMAAINGSITASHSVAAGTRPIASGDGVFMFSDASLNANYANNGNNSANFRVQTFEMTNTSAAGQYWLWTNNTAHVSGTLQYEASKTATNSSFAPDFRIGSSETNIGAAFTLSLPLGVDSTLAFAQTTVFIIRTNGAAGSPFALTTPTGASGTGTAFVTNTTIVTVYAYGKEFTNYNYNPIK